MASEDKKIILKSMGPGGMRCPFQCCGPPPGKKRKKFLRSVKRKIRQAWRKRIKNVEEEENSDGDNQASTSRMA